MQYRSPNANLDSCCQSVSLVSGDNGWLRLADLVGRSICALLLLLLVTQLCCGDKRIDNKSVHRKEQLATIINTIYI